MVKLILIDEVMPNADALVISKVCPIASKIVSGSEIFVTFTMTLTKSKVEFSFNALRKRKQ